MTTSSLILNALVCRAIAAVRARSSQNFLRASAETAVEIPLDLDDRRRRIADRAEEFEAHGANRRRHLVQDESRRRDDPVAAFLLHAGQSGEKLVGDVLAETRLPKRGARNCERL